MDEEQLIRQLLQQERYLAPAAEKMRTCLNDVIDHHQLNGTDVLSILARLTAAYIHQLQRVFDAAGADELVEETFQSILTAYLTNLDMESVSAEVEKVQRETIN